MAPAPVDDSIKDYREPIKDTLGLPDRTLTRLKKAGVDLSQGYPYRPSVPLYLQDVYNLRSQPRDYQDAGARADKSKKSLFSAATKVTDLTTHIGTEIEGLQLKDLTDQQKDELALLIAERSVVFFRNQDLSPKQQLELGKYYGLPEVHVSLLYISTSLDKSSRLTTDVTSRQPQVPQVPGELGLTVIWPDLQATERNVSFRNPGGASRWHTDLVHELQPAG